MHGKGMISIWFFIGVNLLLYGLIITAASIYYTTTPPPTPVVLGELHAGIWWGGFLLLVGIFYAIRFRPGKTRI